MRRVSGKVPEGRRMGPATVLTDIEEQKLETWLLTIAKKGYPIHRSILLDTVKRIIDEQNRETVFKNNRPGLTWWEAFKKRHPKIAEKEAESLTLARAAVTEESVRKWFSEVSEWLKREDHLKILEDPSRVFNADETGFLLCPKTGRVIGEKGSKEDFYVVTSNREKEQLTVLGIFSADGVCVPPMIVYPYTRLPREVGESVPDSWGIGITPTGWMNGDVFFEWMANHFIPYLEKEKVQFPIILFVDGHRSHLTMHLSELCEAKGVILVALHPNCTHMLQPADVSVFAPLKKGWQAHVREWKFNNDYRQVNKSNFAPILQDVFKKKATPIVIQNGFRKCGLYPFEADSVDYSKCLKSRLKNHDGQPQKSTSDGEPRLHEGVLAIVESKIDSVTLAAFKSSGPVWEGSEKAYDLFYVWSSLASQRQTTLDTIPENVGVDELDNLAAEGQDSAAETSSTPQPVAGPSHENSSSQGIVSPFNPAAPRPSLEKYSSLDKFVSPFKKYLSVPKTPEKIQTRQPRKG